jgi:cysteinyl-tRNA synthetase
VSGKNPEIEKIVQTAKMKFEECLDDDLNISGALAAVFDLVRDINRLLREGQISKADAMTVLEFTCKIDSILGVLKKPEVKLEDKAEELIRKRDQARAEKDWQLADQIRKELDQMGIVLEDTASGTKWKKKI